MPPQVHHSTMMHVQDRHSRRRHSRPRHGFTLFEVALSLLLVSFGVVSVMMLFPVGIKAQMLSRYQILASAKAMEMIDTFSSTTNSNLMMDREGVLRAIARAAGERLILVSDAAPIAGNPPGRYRCFGRDVVLTSTGAVNDLVSGGFAGSAASLADCVAVARRLGLVGSERAARERPLALLSAAQ